MSQSNIIRFPRTPAQGRDNNPTEANAARERIAELPDTYLAHAAPTPKEHLVRAVAPISPAAASEAVAMPLAEAAGVAAPATPTSTPAKRSRHKATTSSAEPPLEGEDPNAAGSRPRLPSRLKPLVTGVVTFVLLFLVFKAPIFLSQLNYLTQPSTASTTANQAAAAVPPAPIINIPKISVNAPVVYATDNSEGAILTDLQSGVVHYANTSLPGQPGNSVIFGHSSNDWWEAGSYKFVFVLLDKLVSGDTFTVNYNSHQYLYQVTSTEVVDPTDVGVLNQTADQEMTLITCTPPGTSWKRLIVHSKQISPAPAAASSGTSTAGSGAGSGGAGTLPSNSPGIGDTLSGWWHDVEGVFGGGNKPSAAGSNDGTSTPSASGAGGATTIPDTQ